MVKKAIFIFDVRWPLTGHRGHGANKVKDERRESCLHIPKYPSFDALPAPEISHSVWQIIFES